MTPTGADLDRMREALLPLRAALRRRALQEAQRVRAAADAEVESRLEGAETEVAAMVAEAREEGLREAGAAADTARAAARRAGRQLVLAARRELYEELQHRVRAETARMVGADWRARVAERARRTLGADACIRQTPDAVTAEANGRRLTWSLQELAARAVEQLGDRVEEAWSP
ncbi:MAG TPA: hypothetical protein VMT69_12635 [Kineosporiaceae bacterium]|nr:hypothetical protein [Kineosporiaceae bacterium]